MSKDPLVTKTCRNVVKHLTACGWYVERMSANAWQTGLPYLYCYHRERGARWVEVKNPGQHEFTAVQKKKWRQLAQAGVGIWILTAATRAQYGLLSGPPNWPDFCKASLATSTGNAMSGDPARAALVADYANEKGSVSGNDDELEEAIQAKLIELLKARGWHVERMNADIWQVGIPDLYCYRRPEGERWVEVKRPLRYSFTKYQRQKFPKWEAAGIPLWILTAATEAQYNLLFKPPNWREFWKPEFAAPTKDDIDAMLDELVQEREKGLEREDEQLRSV